MTPLGADTGAVRIDVAGRQGWRLSDGSLLWDDGEKEVPTSGISDETKRAQARIDAGDAWEATKNGVSRSEIEAVKGTLSLAGDPEKLQAARKAAAKARANRKPANPAEKDAPEAAFPPTDVEIRQDLRIQAKKLLEREIDRLEELKSMAIAGLVLLVRNGVAVPGGNPPMRLHEQVLELLKVADSGNPEQMIAALDTAIAWQALTSGQTDDTTLPQPPSGVPMPPAVIPPPQDYGATPQASHAVAEGGKPIEYPSTPSES